MPTYNLTTVKEERMKDYKRIWNDLSATSTGANFYVCCIDDEDDIRSNGELTTQFLRQALNIGPTDRVLEIGCGVARIGRELAPYCGEWHGSDISGNMLAYAAQRTAGMSNVYLHELPEASLSIFPDNYFDRVYCTIVFMHLDKPEVFNYIRETLRVLKPGGSAYFDTYNILAPEAWQEFRKILDSFSPTERPGHVSQFSTPQEMRKYMEEAGFEGIEIEGESNPQLVTALGYKPSALDGSQAYQEPDSDSVGAIPTIRPWGVEGGFSPDATVSNEQGPIPQEEDSSPVERQESVAKDDRYERELAQIIATKNAHIAKLERIVKRQERMLSLLPVRAALGLRRRLGSGRKL